MINIISSFDRQVERRGPGKVFGNLVRGLDKIRYPYVINQELNATKRLWVHDSVTALYSLRSSGAFKALGPNLFLLPADIPRSLDLGGALYLQPSDWAKRFWEGAGFTACPTTSWPVGIDTDLFRPAGHGELRNQVILYHKRRDPGELRQIREVLGRLRVPHILIMYGEYLEDMYRQALRNSAFVLWHGCHESQGIALEEALACDVPVLVCDVSRLSEEKGGYKYPTELGNTKVTSAPYFDESCGLKMRDLSQLEPSIGFMLDHRKEFAPRAFVMRHLSLDGQARAFVDLWQHWGLTYAQGLLETASVHGSWHAPLSSRIRVRLETRFQHWLRGHYRLRRTKQGSSEGANRPPTWSQRVGVFDRYRRRLKDYARGIPHPAVQRLVVAFLEARNSATERKKYSKWLRAGKPIPAPPWHKQQVVRGAARSFGISTLVETGTFEGQMIQAVRNDFRTIYSLELDPELNRRARVRFADARHIILLHGDSGAVLKSLLPDVREACVFWLDAHYSGGQTIRADKESPIQEELEAISGRSSQYDDVILIDDASDFGAGDYPALDWIRTWAATHGYREFEIADDIIRIQKNPAGGGSL
jgi:hypothetical protein